MKKNKIVLISLVFLISILIIISLSNSEDNWTIDENLNTINVSTNNLYASAPFNITHPTWAYFELESYDYEGEIQGAWLINTEDFDFINPQISNPKNVTSTYSYSCNNEFTFFEYNATHFWCYNNLTAYGNDTGEELIYEHNFDWGNLETKTAYWNVTKEIEWQNIPKDKFEIIYFEEGSLINNLTGMNKGYILNTTITSNHLYRIRAYIDINKNGFTPEKITSKYWWAIKPGTWTWQETFNNKFYIDPWVDSSWSDVGMSYLDNNLIAYWNLNETLTIGYNKTEDLVTGKYNCSVEGIVADEMDGIIENDFQFANGDLECGDVDDMDGIEELTLNFWVNTTDNAGTDVVFRKGEYVITGLFRGAGIDFQVTNASASSCDTNDLPALNDGDNHMVTIVYNGSGLNTYLDGESKENVTCWAGGSALLVANANNLTFARRGDPTSPNTLPFLGEIDEISLYNRSLNYTEVQDHYNSGSGITYEPAAGSPPADSINPNVTINSPINNTYNYNLINFNTTVIDETSITDGTCWMTIDSGETNLTMTNDTYVNDYNVTNDSIVDGSYKANFYCNDTAGNLNDSEFIEFSIDTAFPMVNLTYPLNITYGFNQFDLNYTITEANPDTCWYTNDSIVNYTITCGDNVTYVNASEGNNEFTIWINDTAGNINSSSIILTVETLENITACRALNLTNTVYYLRNNITTTGSCLTITQNNITINFNGFHINGDCGFWDDGITINGFNDTTIKNGRLDSFYHQIYITASYNFSLSDFTFNGSCYADTFNSFHTSTITNVTGLGSSSGGLYTAGDNNTFSDCNIYNYIGGGYDNGITLAGGSNIIQNSYFEGNDNAVYISDRHNSLINNTIHSSKEYGIYLASNSDENNIINNTIWNCSANGIYSCIYIDNSDDCLIENNKINNSHAYGIVIESGFTDSLNNMIKDTTISNINLTAVNLTDAGGLNNTFLNTTYDDEYVDSGNEIVRRWYYKAYVNDTLGNAVPNAIISEYNISNILIINITTDTTGYTNLSSIIEYVNDGTVNYYSNYSINATRYPAYQPQSHTYNSTIELNNYKDVFTLTPTWIPADEGGGGGGGGTPEPWYVTEWETEPIGTVRIVSDIDNRTTEDIVKDTIDTISAYWMVFLLLLVAILYYIEKNKSSIKGYIWKSKQKSIKS